MSAAERAVQPVPPRAHRLERAPHDPLLAQPARQDVAHQEGRHRRRPVAHDGDEAADAVLVSRQQVLGRDRGSGHRSHSRGRHHDEPEDELRVLAGEARDDPPPHRVADDTGSRNADGRHEGAHCLGLHGNPVVGRVRSLGSAEARQVRGVHVVVPAERRHQASPVLHRVAAQPMHEDERLPAARLEVAEPVGSGLRVRAAHAPEPKQQLAGRLEHGHRPRGHEGQQRRDERERGRGPAA